MRVMTFAPSQRSSELASVAVGERNGMDAFVVPKRLGEVVEAVELPRVARIGDMVDSRRWRGDLVLAGWF